MISPISGSHPVAEAYASPQPAPSQPASTGHTLPEDTVSISSKGRAATAAGDADRDGDSH